MMENKRKKGVALLPILLACVLLVTDLPRVLNAAGLFQSEEQQVETQEPEQDEEQSAETEKKDEPVDEKSKELEEPQKNGAADEEAGKDTQQQVSRTKDTVDSTKGTFSAGQDSLGEGDTNGSGQAEASQITPVPNTDPMYWMGQRTGGDTNRAMVWFGEYWQKKDNTTKSPILWRTLRSDGEGNYGGAVTLLSEYALNSVFFQEAGKSNYWCNSNTNINSSDLRAYMNGVGTGAMNADADLPSSSGTAMPYNEIGGGAGNIKGSFYANAFGDSEKNLIVPTFIEKEVGYSGAGKDVTDKIFALSGHRSVVNADMLNPAYFSENADRLCYSTAFASVAGNTIANSPFTINSVVPWWSRSPYVYQTPRARYVAGNGAVYDMVTPYGATARPGLNLDPRTVVFSSASSGGRAPIDTFTDAEIVGLDTTIPPTFCTAETSLDGDPVYGQGASYRVFARSSENSKLGISNGSTEGSIVLTYQGGNAGQFINALVVTDAGEKWTGRVKHIEDNKEGTVEFSVPQRNPGTSVTQNVRVFAWRETEETKTACIPNYQDLTVKEAASHKITYDNGGGTSGAASMGAQSVVQGAVAVLRPCTFKKTNNYFVGWKGSDDQMYSDQEVITPTGDLTLTAVWSNDYKTITYKPGNGSGSDKALNLGTGSKVIIDTPAFTAPGSASFIEWNTESDGSGDSYQPGDSVTLDDNLTLYAIYGTKATITYDGNGATEANTTQNGYLEKQFELKSDGFTRSGYKLTGWNTASDGSGTAYRLGEKVTLTGDCTLFAQWEAIGYSIVFNADDAARGDVPAAIPLTWGGTGTIPDTNLLRDQYIFDGWNTKSDGSGTAYKKDDTITVDSNFPDGALTLYAQWKAADNYTVSYDLNKPAAASDSDVSGSVPSDDVTCYNDGIHLKTTAAEPGVKIKGYVFKGWSASELTPPLSPDLTAPGDELTPTAPLTLHAIWASATQWTVTYSGATSGVTGSFPTDDGAYYDDGFTYTTTIKANSQTRTGYTFLGWSKTQDSATAEYAANDTLTLTGDITLYAVWEANTYTVKYDRNASAGSGSAPADQTGTYGSNFTVADAPSDMKNPGRSFTGWNAAKEGTGKSYTAGQSYTLTGDITLYAQWSDNDYTIVFDGNGATKGDVPDSIQPSYNENVTMPNSNLYKVDQVFDGWNTKNDGSGTSYAVGAKISINDSFPTGTTTLYAKWKDAGTYQLSYNTNADGDTVTTVNGDLPANQSYSIDGISNVLNVTNVVPVRKGYHFGGWSTTANGTVEYAAGQKLTLSKDTVLYAVWTQGTFSLIYHFNSGNDAVTGSLPATVTGGPTTTGIKAAGQGDLLREYHKFTGWNTESDGSGTAYQEEDPITLDDNIDLYAQWQRMQSATLTYGKNCLNPETIMPSADGGHYDDGMNDKTTIATDIPVRYGYIFKGWSTDEDALPTDPGLLKGGDEIKVTSDVKLYAIWELGNYTLTYDKNIKNSDPDQAGGSWPAEVNGNVNLTMNVHDGRGITRDHYTLKEWNTKSDGSGTTYALGAAFSLIADTTLYAVWEPDSYTIHYDGGASDVTGTIPQDQSGKYKTSYQAAQGTGMTRPGASFSGWNDQKNGSGNSFTPGATYQYEGNKTLYAQWEVNVWTIQFKTDSADQGDAIGDITAGLNANVKLPDGSGLKKAKYTFDGWNTAPDGVSGTTYQGGADLTIQESTPKTLILYAKWKRADAYQLTYDKNSSEAGGTVPPAVTCYNDKINHTTDIPQNSLTRTGYTFSGWSETKNGMVQYHPGDTIDMAEKGSDLTLYAVWTLNSFKLMYDANAADITGTVPAAVTGNVDSDIKAAAQGSMYRPEHKFSGWNTEPDGSGATVLPGKQIKLDANKVLYAVWTPLTAVHVTYKSGCDDLAVEPTLPKDSKDYFDDGIHTLGTVSTQKPVRYGYEFYYWATEENGGGTKYRGGEDIRVTKDLTLYAVWDMGNYTLSYNANARDVQGQMPADKYGTVLSNVRVEDNTGFHRPYYTFKGWNTKADGMGITYQPGDPISLGRDTTLYAQWRETVYKIRFDLNSPVISQAQGTVPDGIQGTHLEKFTVPGKGNLSCPKYKFTGWNTDPDGDGELFKPGEEYAYEVFENYGDEVTLYANWVSVPPYEVVYHKNASDVSGEVPVDSNLYIPDDGSNLATILGPGSLKRKGYEFVCWTTKKDGSGSRYVEGSRFRVTAHTVLYAQWTPGTYTLTYDKNGSSVTGKAPAGIKSSSQEDIKAAGPNTMKLKNYEFLGWSTKKTATTATYKEGAKFRILEDTKLYAVWKKLINVNIEHTEGLKPTANTNVSVSQGTKLGELKLPEVKEGYEIDGWLVNGEKVTNPDNYVLSKDSEVQAIVKKKPADSGKKDPSGDAGKDKDNNSGSNNSGGNNSGGTNPGGNNSNSGNSGTNSGTQSDGGSNLGSTSSSGGLATKAAGENKKINPSKDTHAPGKYTPVEKKTGGTEGGSENIAQISDGQVPLAGSAESRSPDSLLHRAYGSPSGCFLHWLVLAGILLSSLYMFLRCRYIRRKKLLQSHFLWDSIIPMAALPLSAAAWLYQYCKVDLWMIAVWLFVMVIGMFADKKSFQHNLEKIETELIVLEEERN